MRGDISGLYIQREREREIEGEGWRVDKSRYNYLVSSCQISYNGRKNDLLFLKLFLIDF